MKIGVLPYFRLSKQVDGEVLSPVLIASVLHHARYAQRYYIITDYEPSHFSVLSSVLRDRLMVVSLADIVSKDTNILLNSLVGLWKSGKAKANHPPTERLCFLRWFAIRDWLDKVEYGTETQYLLNDWDDLAFSDPYESLSKLAKYVGTCHVGMASFTEVGLCQWMQPNLTFFRKKNIDDYCKTVGFVVSTLKGGGYFNLKDKGFVDDCLPWAYQINKYRARNDEVFINLLFGEGQNRVARQKGFFDYFNTTVRTPERFEKMAAKIPERVNYTGNSSGLVSLLRLGVDKDVLTIRNIDDGRSYAVVNLHFTGVESKYILLSGYLKTAQEYYYKHEELACNMEACGIGKLIN